MFSNKPLKFIWQFLKKSKYLFFLQVFLVILADTLNMISGNKIFKTLLDNIGSNSITFNQAVVRLFFYVTLSLSSYIVSIIIKKIMLKTTFLLQYDMRNFLFQFVIKHQTKFFSDNFAGSLNIKMNDIVSGAAEMTQTFPDLMSNLIVFLFITFSFLKFSHNLFLFVIIWLFFYAYFFIKISKKINKLSSEKSEEESKYSGQIIDCLNSISNIKSFSKEKFEKARMKKLNIEINKKNYALTSEKCLFNLFNFISNFLLIFSVLFTTLKYLYKNKITLGDFVFFNTCITQIIWWLRYFFEIIIKDYEIHGKMEQALKTLIVPHIIENKKNSSLSISNGFINISDISFQYKPNLPYVFSNFNLKISPSTKVGIVGYSGSGKSTLINLLLRFYDVSSGGIYIDNQNIKEVTQESLRKNISYIPQEPILFHRTIRENILYGKLDATEEELIEATKKACCYDFITNNLENKFDTLVGERGIKLSGGQRQRIAIARAILKNSKILILDEATSALDSITEKEIQTALNNLMKNKTVIVIAHRLSTLNIMDRIVVIDKGQIIEDGTKEQLLSNPNGLFKQMWNMQREGVIG